MRRGPSTLSLVMDDAVTSTGQRDDKSSSPWDRRMAIAIIATVVVALSVVVVTITTGGPTASTSTTSTTLPPQIYPMGNASSSEPSGMAPPSTTALWGYRLAYVADFKSPTLPPGWDVYNGRPGGDPGAKFGYSHVVVKNGQLVLQTYRDITFHDRWVTGGLCQCGLGRVYGAYFVRSRVTGAGANEVQLLWPQSNKWPPEVDFNESSLITGTIATVHWSIANHLIQVFNPVIDQTKWHTWGVIWMANRIIYTVDGREWGAVNNPQAVPTVPMTLDLEQTTKCPVKSQCPTYPVDMQVDWVAEYVSR